MLSIRNISKSFVQRGTVLDNLSLEVASGSFFAIMGPSGSGKTTLLNLIGLLDKPDTGEIYFRGVATAVYSDTESAIYRSRNIGFVFQDHLLLPYLTVTENIFLPLLACKYTEDEYINKESQLTVLMEKTGITDLKDKYPAQISGGEAQRVAVVRALANNPSILLADEPTGSLDKKNADIIGDLLSELNRDLGITIILATHSAELAKKSSGILQIDGGRLIPAKTT
jgi:lipoprotein-releasing system ATP-binding protein